MKIFVAVALLVGTSFAEGNTFTVTNTNATGAGSLRQAILDANALAGPDLISFAISGAGPFTISPTIADPLPSLTDSVIIDGYTQTGAGPNTLINSNNALIKIQIDGLGAGTTHGITIASSGNGVRGLSITRFGGGSDGINIISGTSNNVVEGNFLGIAPTPSAKDFGNGRNGIYIFNSSGNVVGGTNPGSCNIIADNSQNGVQIENSASASNNVVLGNVIGLLPSGAIRGNGNSGVELSGVNNTIGGEIPGAGNIISGNLGNGIRMSPSTTTHNSVLGNFIGLDRTGTLKRGNGANGIYLLDTQANIIGGINPGARNVISGNALSGIYLQTLGIASRGYHTVLGNFIGTDFTGTLAVANSGSGIAIQSDGNIVGSVEAGAGNIVAFNGDGGVRVFSGTNNVVRGNAIFSNTSLGIDVGSDASVTANDLGDVDSGANNLQNFPLLTNAIVSRDAVTIQGTLNSRASTSFLLDFYSNTDCDSSGHGQGRTWLMSLPATTDAGGSMGFSIALPASARNKFIAATATDPDGNSSEFSACLETLVTMPPLTFTVSNTNDNGPGSLRQALLDVDQELNFGSDTIAFNIPGGGVKTIFPLSALPTPNDPVIIDGYTQPGTVQNTLLHGSNAELKVRLDGSRAGAAGVDGLHLTTRSNVVRGLCIVRFSGDGIEFQGSGGNFIRDLWLGFDISEPAGIAGDGQNGGPSAALLPSGNGEAGLYFNGSDFEQGYALIMSGNGGPGLNFFRPPGQLSGPFSSQFSNVSSMNNGVAGFLFNANDISCGSCDADSNPTGFSINGDDVLSFNSTVKNGAHGWVINGNDDDCADCIVSAITGNAFSNEAGTGSDFNVLQFKEVGGAVISNNNLTAPAGIFVETDGADAVRIHATLTGPAGTHLIRVYSTQPDGTGDRVASTTVTKSASDLILNTTVTTRLPVPAGATVQINTTTVAGTSPLSAPVTASLGTQPDLKTTATPFTPATVNVGVKGSIGFQVKNEGVGAATAGLLAISTTGTKIVNIDVPSGATFTGPVNGVFTVSFGQIAAGDAITVTVAFVVPLLGTFSVSGTVTPVGQTDANTANNTGSRSGVATAAAGSTPPITHGETGSAGNSDDPISLLTGELYKSFPADLNTGGPMPLRFSRYYASFLERLGRSGTLGNNWRHNFEWTLANRTNTVEVISDVGRRIIFTNSAGLYLMIGRNDIPFVLQTNGADFFLGDPRSQRLYTFDGSGKLTRIQDGHGNAHALAYTGTNLASVSDGLGRMLTFEYAGGFLTNVTDGARAVAFTQSENNLVSVRDALGFITSCAYDPTNAASRGLMTATVMPEGNVPYAQTFDSLGRVATQTESGTNIHSLTYAVNVTTLTDPLGRTRRNVHTTSGELLAFTDESNLSLGMDYNSSGQRIAVADRLGNLTRLGYHAASGYLSAIINTDGTSTTVNYTNRVFGGVTFFDVARITYPDGTREHFSYDAGGNVLTRTDRGGAVSSFTYNARGQLLTAQNPLGGVTTHTYNANGTLDSRADTDTGTTTFAYDEFSRLTNVVNSDGTMLKTVYDANDHITFITDERSNIHTFTYDDNGNVVSAIDPLSQTARFAYDERDRLTQATDRLGKAENVHYDPLDQIASVINRNGNVTRFTYDTRRRLASIIDPGNQAWNFGYDNEALLSSSSNPLNQTNRIRRDALGYETGFTNALNQSIAIGRDALRRVTQTVDALRRTNGFGYDARGLLASATTPVVGAATYERNSLGLLSRITDLNGSAWNFGYTPMGRAQFIADPLNRTNRVTYDNRGRSSVSSFADGATCSNSYNEAGSLTRRQFSDGMDLVYTYDALNRMVAANEIALAYDAEGRVTNTTSSSATFGGAYDAGGRLINISYNAGAFSVTYTYDSRDRLIAVSDSLTSTTVNFVYDNAGRLIGVNRSNGVNQTNTFDAAGRLTRIQDGSLIDLQYALDAVGQTTNLNYTVPLDPTNGLSASTLSWTHDAAHQISNPGYGYDARGRLINAPGQSFQYDDASRLRQINSVMLGYNGFNDIVTRADSGTTTRYFYNRALAMHPIVAEKNETSGEILRYYVWSPAGRLLYLIDVASGNAVRHFHFDRMGSTLALTDAAGAITDSYAYTPYGELLARTGTSQQPFLYVGRFGVRHESAGNLVHMRARYYDPVSGRFLSPDPIWPRLNAALELNPYQYVSENPLKSIDPSGLTGKDEDAFAIEVLFRFAAGDWQGATETKTRGEQAAANTEFAAQAEKLGALGTPKPPPLQPNSSSSSVSVANAQAGEQATVGDLNGGGAVPIVSDSPAPRAEKVRFYMNRVSTTRSARYGVGLRIGEESNSGQPAPAVTYGINRISTTRSVMHRQGLTSEELEEIERKSKDSQESDSLTGYDLIKVFVFGESPEWSSWFGGGLIDGGNR
jgi:RHS repeat-associated protein